MESTQPEKSIGTVELRDYLGYRTVRTVYRKVKQGMPYEWTNGQYRFRRSAVDAWLVANGERKRKETNGNG